MTFSKNEHSNSIKRLIYKRKTTVFITAVSVGDPNEVRTRVTAVRGRCPRPLDDGTVFCLCFYLIFSFLASFFIKFASLSAKDFNRKDLSTATLQPFKQSPRQCPSSPPGQRHDYLSTSF